MYHLSFQKTPITIESGKGIFGGLFFGDAGGMDGDTKHYIDIESLNTATHHYLSYDVEYSVFESLEVLADLSDDQKAELYEAVTNDDDYTAAYELLCEVYPQYALDDENGAWLGQRLRGEFALAAGFDAVEMNDETGISLLVMRGETSLTEI